MPKKKKQPKSDDTVHSLDDIRRLYPDLINETEVGIFSGELYHIHTDPTVSPKCTVPRPVPGHQQDAFMQELNKVLNLGAIVSVDKATP